MSSPPEGNSNGGRGPTTGAGEARAVHPVASTGVAPRSGGTRRGTPRLRRTGIYLSALTCFIYVITFVKAVRLPNRWAATHMTFNYSNGFVRRGLVGELIRRIGGPRAFHYLPLAIISIGLLVAVVATMVVFVRRSIAVARADLEYRMAVMVLGASPGALFFINEIGYFDYIGLLALLTLMLVATSLRQRRYLLFPAVAVAGGALAFVHEILVAMFVPTMFFALLCLVVAELRHRHAPRSTWLRWLAGAVVAAILPFVSVYLVSALGTKSPAATEAMQAATETMVDFELRGDAFRVLSTPFSQVVKYIPRFWTFAQSQAYLFAGFYAIAPTLVFIIVYGVRVMLRVRVSGAARTALVATFVLATMGPLLLNLVGWDNARWNAISVVDGFCCIGIARLFFGAEVAVDRGNNLSLLMWGAAVTALGLCTSYDNFLFDEFRVRWFPFTDPFQWW